MTAAVPGGPRWRKSSASHANGNCVEVGQDGAGVLVRDSRDPGGAVLVAGPVAWAAFLTMVRSG